MMLKLYIARLLLKIFYILPVNRKKNLFSSYEGGPITCNPKYIYQELKKRYGDALTYVWECNNPPERTPENEKLLFVKHNSLPYIYQVMTSGVIITNSGLSAVFPLRRSQISINTWHGAGCYKKVGKDLAETKNAAYVQRRKYAEKNTTYYLSGCEAWTRVFSSAVLSNPAKFLPVGSPRVDILIHGITKAHEQAIRDMIGTRSRIILYAPTYRGRRDTPQEAACPLDVGKLLDALKERFGGEWVFAYRCHYATASHFKGIDHAIDLSQYDDMQELLLVSDVLISDYSSSVWEYSFTGKPCFLYCYDLNQYTEDRDFYTPIRDWHFPVSETMDELLEQIKSFSEVEFRKGMELHHKELGSYENGDATQKTVDIIMHHVNGDA